ncbi:MAG: lysozyme [Xenococcaceae cyanobacterium MO_167.B27]|nr:lysozyme [Xenococcaceae cyanobacterium MO_167.B27]
MNKITHCTSLTVTAIAMCLGCGEILAITSLTSLSASISVTNNQTIPRQKIPSSIPVENHLVDTAVQPQKVPDKALKLESSLAQTVTLVKEFEGFRSLAYIDTDGTVVIGYGMGMINGRKVQLGDRISEVKGSAALTEELREIQQQILAASTVELNSNELVALTSFAFNVGVQSLFKSTLFRKLHAGDFNGAANEFPRWNKANIRGRLVPLAGLTRRRLTEKSLFLTKVN